MTKMISASMPDDDHLIAMGKVAVRHGHMDHTFKMVAKSLLGIPVGVALDATEFMQSRQLREWVLKIAKQKIKDQEAMAYMRAFVTRAWKASDRRNEILHAFFAEDGQGNPVLARGEDWPTVAEMEALVDEMTEIVGSLNQARHEGRLTTTPATAPIEQP